MSDTENSRRLTPKNNFESFDLWSQASFALWSNVRFDFELIAELTRHRKSTRMCLDLLQTVNECMKQHPEDVFFDGTIKCLKFLVKNGYLNISDLPKLTSDEKYLVALLQKYSDRLDVIDIFNDIEEPTIRAILLEYPNLLNEILGDELGRHLISKAISKNGITDYESFVAKLDDGENSIEVDKEKGSKEAMKCKLIYVGLLILNKKISFTSRSTITINQLATLTDDKIESEDYNKSTFNSIYAAFYGSDEWNKRKLHLTGTQILLVDFQLLTMPDNHMSLIYDLLLKEETEKIGRKYFGDEYKDEGFIASLAIKMVIVIIIFRASDFQPKNETADVDLFGKGAMLDGLNYAVRKTGNKAKPLELKEWFLDYYRNELDKRVAFIKLQADNRISIAQIRSGIERVIYLPVFESFRFFYTTVPSEILSQTIQVFKNREIDNVLKDDILVNLVINIQKIVGAKRPTDAGISQEEKYYKDVFILLINNIFENLVKKIIRSLGEQSSIKSYYEKDDLFSDASLAILELILNFDLSKNDSFIGYIGYNLRLKVQTSSRNKKTDSITYSEKDFEEDFLDNIPDGTDFIKEIDNKAAIEKIKQHIEALPEKQKEAIRKLYEKNEKLSETERKSKNRGLNKIKELMGKT